MNRYEIWILSVCVILLSISFGYSVIVLGYQGVASWLIGMLAVTGLYTIWDVRLIEGRKFPWQEK